MPNWCLTDYRIEGSEESLKKINDALLNHSVAENSSDTWEGNILIALGYTEEDLRSPNEHYYLRGFVSYYEPPESFEYPLSFSCEEAWDVTDFRKLLERKLPDIKVYFTAEESGNEYYVTNDEEGIYFPDRYLVDANINNDWYSEYFETKEDALEYISQITDCKTEEDIEKFNENRSDADSDEYITIHEFKVIE